MQKSDLLSKVIIVLFVITMVSGIASAVIMSIEKPYVKKKVCDNTTNTNILDYHKEPVRCSYDLKELSPLNSLVINIATVSLVLFLISAAIAYIKKKQPPTDQSQ